MQSDFPKAERIRDFAFNDLDFWLPETLHFFVWSRSSNLWK
jgi:hypothetical protein